MKTKIIVISTVGLIYDGITSVILSYMQALDLKNLDIYVVATIKVEPNIKNKLEKLGCHIVDLPSRRNNTIKYLLSLVSFIKRNKIQVMHAHGNSGTLAIEMIAGWLGGCSKRIAHSHNTQCDQVRADRLLRPIFNLFYTDAVACSDLAGKWLFGSKPYTVLRNGRNIQQFKFNNAVRMAMRNEFKITDEIAIGHVGGFFEQKNHRFLLKIYRAILMQEPTTKLFMIGDGVLKRKIEEEAADIKDHLFFVGTTDRVSDYLQLMDGMLLPSLFEGLPLVAVEWQINGLPCILADTITKECAFTDTVKFMSLEDSAELWASNIIEMIKSNNRESSASIAKDKVKLAGFDINDSVNSLEQIYTQS